MGLNSVDVRSAEKAMRPFGIVSVFAGLVWTVVTKVWEHAILTWVADRLGEEFSKWGLLRWPIEHPVRLFMAWAVGYCLFIVILAQRSAEARMRAPVEEGAGSVRVETSGQSSAAVVGIGTIGAGARVDIGNKVIHQVQQQRNMPYLSFVRWGEIPPEHPEARPVFSPSVAPLGLAARSSTGGQPTGYPPQRTGSLQRGFFLANDGGPAYEVSVCRFEVDQSIWISKQIVRVAERNNEEFAFAWLDNPWKELSKWDLDRAMAKAANRVPLVAVYQSDYTVKVSLVYRDIDQNWFRGTVDMTYIRSQGRINFGVTSREELGQQRPEC